jgi:hypothetical protein
MLPLALALALSFGLVVLQGIDREGETLDVTLVLLPCVPFLFMIALLTGP